ncbi:unnamed protein product, partial [Onchocerca ochengi]
MLISR